MIRDLWMEKEESAYSFVIAGYSQEGITFNPAMKHFNRLCTINSSYLWNIQFSFEILIPGKETWNELYGSSDFLSSFVVS